MILTCPSAGFGCPRSSHRVGSPLLSFVRFPYSRLMCIRPIHPDSRRPVDSLDLTASWVRLEVANPVYVPIVTFLSWVSGRLPRKLMMHLSPAGYDLHSSSISSVDPTSALGKGYDLAQTRYNSRVPSTWTGVVSF